jgi:hypothetical protein
MAEVERDAGKQMRGANGGEVYSQRTDGKPGIGTVTTYIAMVSGSAASGSRPIAWHHAAKAPQAARLARRVPSPRARVA